MATNSQTVSVQVAGGPSASVPWTAGMNAQQALEAMWRQLHDTDTFTYALQYYGSQLGYLVFMINETYDTFISKAKPFYYWEFLVNGTHSNTGIDSTKLNAGDAVSFAYTSFDPDQQGGTQLRTKYTHQMKVLGLKAKARPAR